jgi:hypothetical protein
MNIYSENSGQPTASAVEDGSALPRFYLSSSGYIVDRDAPECAKDARVIDAPSWRILGEAICRALNEGQNLADTLKEWEDRLEHDDGSETAAGWPDKNSDLARAANAFEPGAHSAEDYSLALRLLMGERLSASAPLATRTLKSPAGVPS